MADESRIQAKVVSDLKKKGWVPFRITTNGWPDRGFMRDGRMLFIEFKSPGKKPRPLQEYIHKLIMSHGYRVYVIDSWESYKTKIIC